MVIVLAPSEKRSPFNPINSDCARNARLLKNAEDVSEGLTGADITNGPSKVPP